MSEEPNHANDYVSVTFVFDDASKQLRAQIEKSCEPFEGDLALLRNKLLSEGHANVDIDDPTLVGLLRKIRNNETGSIVLGTAQTPIGLTFEYDPETRELCGILAEAEFTVPITFASIKERLVAEGYESFDIGNNDISNIVQKLQQRKLGRYTIGKKPEYTALTFVFSEETGQLIADLTASDEEVLVSRASIMEELKKLEYDNFFFYPNALDKLYNQINKNERGRYIVGEKRDADIKIDFDDDFMVAYISVSPPQGGRDLDEHLLDVAFADAGIYRECCDEEVIKKTLEDKTAEHEAFAKGTEPIDGIDAIFEPIVEEVEYSTPNESKTGKIDLREVINFTLLEADTPLMKRTPAIQGQNGRNVKGQVITAVEGEDTPFDEDLPGAKISDTDPNLLISTCKGHPVILNSGVKVDNTVVVNNVDMSTGNIEYDGSLLVKGEVKPGMKINVTGDIIVKGVVTKASLRAKNNITIECGVIGSDPTKDGEESPPAIVRAGGDVKAQYINLAEVHAGRDVEVREYISHCSTDAKHKVFVGQKGGKGRIFGGTCYGQSGIYANSIGANGGTKTLVCAGTPQDQQKQYEQLVSSHENRITQSNQLREMLTKYEEALIANPTDIAKAQKAQAIKNVLSEIQNDIDKMSDTIGKINRHFKEAKKAEVSISKSAFPNVNIAINGADFLIRQESKGGIFVKQGEDIRWLNYTVK